MKKRRLSFQAIFARDVEPPKDGKYKSLPRSFAARASAYYDAPPLPIPPAQDAESFLLDDDPFADLTGGPRGVPQDLDDAPAPTSPLAETPPHAPPWQQAEAPPGPGPAPTPTRTVSHTHTTPAHQKPAFKPRPSLPSLHTLAQMSVVVQHKVRRGRVGAGLPFEPWDLDTDAFTASPASITNADAAIPPLPSISTPPIAAPTPIAIPPGGAQKPKQELALSTTPTPTNIHALPLPLPHHLSSPPSPSSDFLDLGPEVDGDLEYGYDEDVYEDEDAENSDAYDGMEEEPQPQPQLQPHRKPSPPSLTLAPGSPPRKALPSLALDPLKVSVEFSSSPSPSASSAHSHSPSPSTSASAPPTSTNTNPSASAEFSSPTHSARASLTAIHSPPSAALALSLSTSHSPSSSLSLPHASPPMTPTTPMPISISISMPTVTSPPPPPPTAALPPTPVLTPAPTPAPQTTTASPISTTMASPLSTTMAKLLGIGMDTLSPLSSRNKPLPAPRTPSPAPVPPPKEGAVVLRVVGDGEASLFSGVEADARAVEEDTEQAVYDREREQQEQEVGEVGEGGEEEVTQEEQEELENLDLGLGLDFTSHLPGASSSHSSHSPFYPNSTSTSDAYSSNSHSESFDAEPALGRNMSRRLSGNALAGASARGRGRGGSGTGSARESRRGSRSASLASVSESSEGEEALNGEVHQEVQVLEVEEASEEAKKEGQVVSMPMPISFPSSQSTDASDAEHEPEHEQDLEARARRRRFRKSSLVQNVLRFAPASPGAASASSSVASPERERERVMELSARDVELMDGLDIRLGDVGDMGIGVEVEVGMEMELRGDEFENGQGERGVPEGEGEGGVEIEVVVDGMQMEVVREEEEEEAEYSPRDATYLNAEGDDDADYAHQHRTSTASASSMDNELGHGSPDWIPASVAFPSSSDLASTSASGSGYSSPNYYYASRSPEQSSLRYAYAHSPPYSTPCATSAPSSSASSVSLALREFSAEGEGESESVQLVAGGEEYVHAGHAHANGYAAEEYDFGWLPGERGRGSSSASASASEYEYEYDPGSDEYEDAYDAYEGIYTNPNRATPPPSGPTVTPVSSSSTPAYSDEELLGANRAGRNGRGLGFASGGEPAFVFPPRHAHAEDGVEPGTSAGTIRASAVRGRTAVRSGAYWEDAEDRDREMVERGEVVEGGEMDASGWEGAASGSGRGYTSGGGGGGGGGGNGGRARSTGRGGDEGYYGSYGGGGGGWAGGNGDGGDDRRGERQSSFSTPSDSESESESSEEDSDEDDEDDYGEPAAAPRASSAAAPAPAPANGADSNSDDDIPLAQRIPSALVAQRTIRRKVREERDQRRRERAAKRDRQTTLRPAGAGGPAPMEVASSSSREAARQAEAAVRAERQRTRTQTLPGAGPGSQLAAAAVEDLTKKLQSMQSVQAERQRALTINTAAAGAGAAASANSMMSPTPARGLMSPSPMGLSPPSRTTVLPEGTRALRPQRSFHRPATAGGVVREEAPMPVDAEGWVKRSTTTRRAPDESRVYQSEDPDAGPRVRRNTTTTRRRPDESRANQTEDPETEGRVVRRATTRTRRAPDLANESMPLTADEDGRLRRAPTTRRAPDVPNEDVPIPVDAEGRVMRRVTTRRPADGKERALNMPAFLSDPPPPPAPAPPPAKLTKARPSGESLPVQISPQAPRHAASRSQGTLTRVFVGDMQRFNMIDIGPATSAKHVLAMVEEQGSLKGWVGTGGWMVFEVAQDFGMERPIRSFELLADVQASWNKDKMINTFIVKLTPLAPILSRSNLPSSSPVYSGFVDWEMKRGKWTKRYLRLREHSLYLSKRESNKDEVFLCSLSNFDAYHVTRLHKAPKPFCFAVKSTDNLSFFENTADYLHMFACNPKDGEKWMEKILLARSYVLYQERNVLFNPKAAAGNASAGNSGGLSRSGTRKGSAPPRAPQAPPLLAVSPLLAAPDRNDVFAPGSLLHQ